MRYIDNFELREWVKDNLRKTIFQKAHALSIQTGCEVLIKLKDDADELAGQQCYATGSLQKDYVNKGLRKHPEEFFVSGETGLPLVDQGIQSDETSLPPKTSSRTNSASSTHQQAGHDDLESFTQLRGPLGKGGTRCVSDQSFQTDVLTASSQHSDTEMKMRAVSLSQNTEFHSTVETEGYGPSCAMDQSMQEEDDGGGGSGDDDIRTLVKMEPGIDLDHIPAALSSSDTPAGVISKTEHISGNIDVDAEDAQDMDDADLTSMSLTDAALSQELDGSGAGMFSDLHVTPSQDTTSKPFQCAICQKAFRSVQVLQKHSVTFHRQGQQGKAIRLAAPRSRSRGGGKHSGGMQSRTNTQTFMHTCTICNQRFPESILLNDHIVKTHLNVSQMIPSAQNAPGPSQLQYANTQGSPQLPQITSVSSLQYQPPMNPTPSAASSYGQSPVAPKPSTSQQGQRSHHSSTQPSSAEGSHMVQLVTDPQNPHLYQNVMVDSYKLAKVERRAHNTDLKKSRPSIVLLNGLIQIVFTQEELGVSNGLGLRTAKHGRGHRVLSQEKVLAVKEYLRERVADYGWDAPTSREINLRFTNKISRAKTNMAKAKGT
ncbi:uncharacterized protein [Amphiura filiformis]|uniref:uncharacterized protein isoform X4 n=1 Tax=Amphiura filiformis TaxID=82378 RepID=UPI003B214CE6